MAGNSTTKELVYVYDVSAPMVRGISVQPQTTSNSFSNSIPVITWFDIDDLDEIKYVVYFQNKKIGEMKKKVSGKMGSIETDQLLFDVSGKYEIKMSLYDRAGNISETTKSFYYDATAPAVESSSACEAEGNIKVKIFGVSDDLQSIDNEVSYEIVKANSKKNVQTADLNGKSDMEWSNAEDAEFVVNAANALDAGCVYDIYYAVRDKSNNYSKVNKATYYYFPDTHYNGAIQFEGNYDEDAGFQLKWDSDSNISKVTLYVASDAGAFEKTIEFDEGNTATVKVGNIQEKVEFRLLIERNDGTKQLSKVIGFMRETDDLMISDEENSLELNEEISEFALGLLDSDQDGLYDCYEIWDLHTDSYCIDTDLDGLSDLYEVFMSVSEPCKKDADLDSDQDGLSNTQECAMKTNPFLPDTDFDGARDDQDDVVSTSITNSTSYIDYNVNIPNNYFDVVDKGMVYNTYWGYTKGETDAYGKSKKYIYDEHGVIQSIITNSAEGAERTIYRYEENGYNLTELVNNNSIYQFTYDEMGLTECRTGDYILIQHQYTEDGQISNTKSGNSATRYIYDECGNIVQTIFDGVTVYEQEYNEEGLLVKTVDHLNDQVYTYQYDENEVEISRTIDQKYVVATESNVCEKEDNQREYSQSEHYQAGTGTLDVNSKSVRYLDESTHNTQTEFSTGDKFNLNYS